MLPGPFDQIRATINANPVPVDGACDTCKRHDAGANRSAPAVTQSQDHQAVKASSGRHDRPERCSLRNELPWAAPCGERGADNYRSSRG